MQFPLAIIAASQFGIKRPFSTPDAQAGSHLRVGAASPPIPASGTGLDHR
jgi:hypothetical protein